MVVLSPRLHGLDKLHGIKITSDPVKYLGAFLGMGKNPENINFQNILDKMKAVAAQWRKHALTLPVRVLIMRSLILSMATHILSTVYINKDHLTILQKICNDFLWRGRNRLQERVVQNTQKWGRLKHIHIKHVMH